MLISGLPERFFVVTKPSPVSQMCDICFLCTFGQLMLQVRGGLKEDDIVGIYGGEDEARLAAMELLGEFPVRPQDALFAEVLVHVMVQPNEDIAAKDLAKAAVEAVHNALRQTEAAGLRHRLAGRATMGFGDLVELKSHLTATGSQVVLCKNHVPGENP